MASPPPPIQVNRELKGVNRGADEGTDARAHPGCTPVPRPPQPSAGFVLVCLPFLLEQAHEVLSFTQVTEGTVSDRSAEDSMGGEACRQRVAVVGKVTG